jgi:hypothetical protein
MKIAVNSFLTLFYDFASPYFTGVLAYQPKIALVVGQGCEVVGTDIAGECIFGSRLPGDTLVAAYIDISVIADGKRHAIVINQIEVVHLRQIVIVIAFYRQEYPERG